MYPPDTGGTVTRLRPPGRRRPPATLARIRHMTALYELFPTPAHLQMAEMAFDDGAEYRSEFGGDGDCGDCGRRSLCAAHAADRQRAADYRHQRDQIRRYLEGGGHGVA